MAPNIKTREISPKRRRTPPRRRFERSPPVRNTKYAFKKEREHYSSRRSREVKEQERYERKIDYRSGSKDNRRELYTNDEKSDRKCTDEDRFYRGRRWRRSPSNRRCQRRNGSSRDRGNTKTDLSRKRGGSLEKSSSSPSSIERNSSAVRDRNPALKEFYESPSPVISIPVRAPLVPVPVARRILLPPMPPRPLIKHHILPGPCLRLPCPPRALRPIIRPVIKVVTPYIAPRHPVMPFRLPVVSSGPRLNFTLPSVQYVMQ